MLTNSDLCAFLKYLFAVCESLIFTQKTLFRDREHPQESVITDEASRRTTDLDSANLGGGEGKKWRQKASLGKMLKSSIFGFSAQLLGGFRVIPTLGY